jgi:hypothetical protein
MRAAIPGMAARGWGRIVNVASAHGLVASPYKSAYVAAKHGLVGLTKVVALELAKTGVTCNAVCPGYVWTPLVERQIDDQAKSHGIGRDQVVRDVLLKNQPNKRFATVEELGALTVFLCSPGAASITGTALPVDGGWTAHRTREDQGATSWTRKPSSVRRPTAGRAGPRKRLSGRSTSPCRAAAPTVPSPGACSTGCSRTSASPSRAYRPPAPGR